MKRFVTPSHTVINVIMANSFVIFVIATFPALELPGGPVSIILMLSCQFNCCYRRSCQLSSLATLNQDG